jgi:pimeloyl-ACP methyl ester carboxylesterase
VTARVPGAVPDVVPRVVDVDGIPMSALVREVPRPRAVVLALHGGASTSAYWDCPNHPRLSLLRVGAPLGFTVVALDRPGYGSSARHADELATPGRRVDVAFAATNRLLAGRSRGAGVFVVGHSIGCELALRMATDDRGADLLGIELAGTGRQHHPDALAKVEARVRDPASPEARGGLRRLLWEPSWLYPPDVAGGAGIASASPRYEGAVVGTWASRDFAELAARVHVPVHYTLGEYERVWRPDPVAVADVAALFTSAPRVAVHRQAAAGHNLSVGLAAAAYHLRVLSSVEECVVGRENGAAGRMSEVV